MKNDDTQLTLVAPEGWGDFDSPSAAEAEMAKGILLKHENLKAAFVEYHSAMSNAVEGFRKVIVELRAADLNPVQRRTVLGYAGFNRQRIAEFGRVVDSSPVVYKRFIDGVIGFRLALEEARGRVSSGADFVARGDESVVKDFRALLQDYKGHVPAKGTAMVRVIRGGLAFTLKVKVVRKKKVNKGKKGGAS